MDFEEGGSETLYFCGVSEIFQTIDGALPEAFWISASKIRDAWEQFKEFSISVNSVVFCGRPDRELCIETVSLLSLGTVFIRTCCLKSVEGKEAAKVF